MKDLTPLEREFFKIVSGWDYDKALEFDRDNFEENQGIVSAESPTAKAAAALCERKMREAIEQDKKLIKELWGLWESLAECGQISIGKNFSENYDKLKKLIES